MKSVEQLMSEIASAIGSARTRFHRRRQLHRQQEVAKELCARWRASGGRTTTDRFHTEVSLNVALDDELGAAALRELHDPLHRHREPPGREPEGDRQDPEPPRHLVKSVRRCSPTESRSRRDDRRLRPRRPVDLREQLRFVEEARIPVSMTGMLQALPKTALHARIKQEEGCGGVGRRPVRLLEHHSQADTRVEFFQAIAGCSSGSTRSGAIEAHPRLPALRGAHLQRGFSLRRGAPLFVRVLRDTLLSAECGARASRSRCSARPCFGARALQGCRLLRDPPQALPSTCGRSASSWTAPSPPGEGSGRAVEAD